MRIAGLCGASRRRWITTTRRQPDPRPAPDLVQRDFNADAPDQLWVADATYVPSGEGFLYLAVVLDVFSRGIVGWSMSSHLYTEVILRALDMALARRYPDGVIHHSDQGCQGTSIAFGRRCREARVRLSMGTVAIVSITPCAKAFSPPLNASCWHAHTSPGTNRHGARSSTSRRRGTTRFAFIAASDIARRSFTNSCMRHKNRLHPHVSCPRTIGATAGIRVTGVRADRAGLVASWFAHASTGRVATTHSDQGGRAINRRLGGSRFFFLMEVVSRNCRICLELHTRQFRLPAPTACISLARLDLPW